MSLVELQKKIYLNLMLIANATTLLRRSGITPVMSILKRFEKQTE
jgi:hypothetical protein